MVVFLMCDDLPLPEHPGLLLGVGGPGCLPPVWGVGGSPVLLQPPTQVITSILQAVLVQDDVPHLQGALRQLLGSHHLHVHVLCLGFTTRFYESLENFGRRNLIGKEIFELNEKK